MLLCAEAARARFAHTHTQQRTQTLIGASALTLKCTYFARLSAAAALSRSMLSYTLGAARTHLYTLYSLNVKHDRCSSIARAHLRFFLVSFFSVVCYSRESFVMSLTQGVRCCTSDFLILQLLLLRVIPAIRDDYDSDSL